MRNEFDDDVADDAHASWWNMKSPRIKEEHDERGKLDGRYLSEPSDKHRKINARKSHLTLGTKTRVLLNSLGTVTTSDVLGKAKAEAMASE